MIFARGSRVLRRTPPSTCCGSAAMGKSPRWISAKAKAKRRWAAACAAGVGPPVGEDHRATATRPAAGLPAPRRAALLDARSSRALGHLGSSRAAQAVPCASPTTRKASGFAGAGGAPISPPCAPGTSAANRTLRSPGYAGIRERRLIRECVCDLVPASIRSLKMCPKLQNSVIWLRFLALTRTFCGATKRSDRPSGGKSLTALRRHHASDHQTCLAGQAWFAAEEMSATPHHPGR